MKLNSQRILLIVVVIVGAGLFWKLSQVSPAPKPLGADAKVETAIFAGGCFWCVESSLEKVAGVGSVESGYTGGLTQNPTYRQVCGQGTGHLEAVRVTYDANIVSYDQLLEHFWMLVDPTDGRGQFVDRGESYTSAIFVVDESQREAAQRSKNALEDSGRFDSPIVTPIRDAAEFYVAEDYHQDYYRTHPVKYKIYRFNSGRDRFIKAAWGKSAH